ncbi:hypothetical protein LTR62_001054 [Meristemomyces frigidus]|uniref:Uncharacterized protein n=1 Tax=Meristemomyces frigidus TaxID=1508187 RepID=A0AAN7T8Q3_9PEZI|nr:hypothetical protein LTR62_001054 [Meristemomyces frigidus]
MDPISILSMVGVCLNISARAVGIGSDIKAVKRVFKEGYSTDIEIDLLSVQIHSLQLAASSLASWLEHGSPPSLSKHVMTVRSGAARIRLKGKTHHWWNEEDLKKYQSVLARQVQALSFFLQTPAEVAKARKVSERPLKHKTTTPPHPMARITSHAEQQTPTANAAVSHSTRTPYSPLTTAALQAKSLAERRHKHMKKPVVECSTSQPRQDYASSRIAFSFDEVLMQTRTYQKNSANDPLDIPVVGRKSVDLTKAATRHPTIASSRSASDLQQHDGTSAIRNSLNTKVVVESHKRRMPNRKTPPAWLKGVEDVIEHMISAENNVFIEGEHNDPAPQPYDDPRISRSGGSYKIPEPWRRISKASSTPRSAGKPKVIHRDGVASRQSHKEAWKVDGAQEQACVSPELVDINDASQIPATKGPQNADAASENEHEEALLRPHRRSTSRDRIAPKVRENLGATASRPQKPRISKSGAEGRLPVLKRDKEFATTTVCTPVVLKVESDTQPADGGKVVRFSSPSAGDGSSLNVSIDEERGVRKVILNKTHDPDDGIEFLMDTRRNQLTSQPAMAASRKPTTCGQQDIEPLLHLDIAPVSTDSSVTGMSSYYESAITYWSRSVSEIQQTPGYTESDLAAVLQKQVEEISKVALDITARYTQAWQMYEAAHQKTTKPKAMSDRLRGERNTALRQMNDISQINVSQREKNAKQLAEEAVKIKDLYLQTLDQSAAQLENMRTEHAIALLEKEMDVKRERDARLNMEAKYNSLSNHLSLLKDLVAIAQEHMVSESAMRGVVDEGELLIELWDD